MRSLREKKKEGRQFGPQSSGTEKEEMAVTTFEKGPTTFLHSGKREKLYFRAALKKNGLLQLVLNRSMPRYGEREKKKKKKMATPSPHREERRRGAAP